AAQDGEPAEDQEDPLEPRENQPGDSQEQQRHAGDPVERLAGSRDRLHGPLTIASASSTPSKTKRASPSNEADVGCPDSPAIVTVSVRPLRGTTATVSDAPVSRATIATATAPVPH